MIDTKELRHLAQAATPGPWWVNQDGLNHGFERGVMEINALDWWALAGAWVVNDGKQSDEGSANAKFIAAVNPATVSELLDRLEAAERNLNCCQGERMEAASLFLSVKTRLTEERDALRAKIEAMERQEPVAIVESWASGSYSRNYKLRWLKGAAEGANLYLAPGAQPAPSLASGDVSLISEGKTQPAPSLPECPYPCGWKNLLKHAMEDGAYLARAINEDEPVTENARAVTMRMVLRLRDVLMAINNAAQEAKP